MTTPELNRLTTDRKRRIGYCKNLNTPSSPESIILHYLCAHLPIVNDDMHQEEFCCTILRERKRLILETPVKRENHR